MKTNGQTLRSAGSLTGADAVAAAETLISDFSNLTVLFPEGSDSVAGTEALPAIWQNWDTFNGILVKAATAATAMKTAAEAGDAAAYGAAVKAVGATCGECHQTFRAAS
jgi:cytochrome c556